MTLGYRSLLRLDDVRSSIAVAEETLLDWLKSKSSGRNRTLSTHEWDGPGIYQLGASSVLQVVHDDRFDDGSQRRLYRLVETNSHGGWIVAITAISTPRSREHQQTIVVDVGLEGVSRDEALQRVHVPRFVRSLLDQVSASDGHAAISSRPTVVRHDDVPELVAAIRDSTRSTPVVVALSPERHLDSAWLALTTSLVTQSLGAAAHYVVNFDAAEAFTQALAPSHGVPMGAVRTYLPEVREQQPGDGMRHRFMSRPALERASAGGRVPQRVQARHARSIRERIGDVDLPLDVRRAFELVRRAEGAQDRALRVSRRLAEAPPALHLSDQDDLSGYRDLAAQWIVDSAPTPAALDRFIQTKVAEVGVAEDELGEAADRIDQADRQTVDAQRRIDDLELDLAQAEQDVLDRDREVAWLRQELAKQGVHPGVQDSEPADWEAPESVEELVARMTPGAGAHPISARVVYTGSDVDAATAIDDRYPSGLYARTLWQYARVLFDFASAVTDGRFQGNVHMYLRDDRVDGNKCHPDRHASRESDSVLNNKAWADERIFPVPTSVVSGGSVIMQAHFKPTHRDQFAPRMHYYDDTAGSGKIFVGYIGRHLTNKQT